MKILLIGKGKMGQAFSNFTNDDYYNIDNEEEIVKFDKHVDVIIDFSHFSLTNKVVELALKLKTPLVIGTTSITKRDIKIISEASKNIPICLDANYSNGINEILKFINNLHYERINRIYINEVHHINKIDSPSGTAKKIKYVLENKYNIPVLVGATRKGSSKGIHEIILDLDEEILFIKHEVKSRDVFVKGALNSAYFLLNKKNGLYEYKDVISNG